MNVFVDTNILLDFLCKREPFASDAAKIFQLGYDGRIKIQICALSYINALYICKRYGYKESDVVASLNKINSFCEVTSVGSVEINKALTNSYIDYEDMVQALSAAGASASVIVTRDKHGFKSSLVKACTPKEFLKNIKF